MFKYVIYSDNVFLFCISLHFLLQSLCFSMGINNVSQYQIYLIRFIIFDSLLTHDHAVTINPALNVEHVFSAISE